MKKRVVAVFSILILLGVGLGIFNFISFGSITGKAIDELYSHELFAGEGFEFRFAEGNFQVSEETLMISGLLVESADKDHSLQVTGYVFDTNGDSIGTFSRELFLSRSSTLDVKMSTRISHNEVGQVLLYFEDEKSSIRVVKQFPVVENRITGKTVAKNTGRNSAKSNVSFLVGIILIVGALLFVVSRLKQHRREANLDEIFAKQHHRKYIDLDVR